MHFAAFSFATAAIVLAQTAHATDLESLNLQGIELGMSLVGVAHSLNRIGRRKLTGGAQ